MNDILKMIRVKHWIKNLLIFVPLICANLISYENVFKCILGFIAFSFVASCIYIINDIKDVEEDKLHPVKKNRPIASGKISKNQSIIISIILLMTSLIINILINKSVLNLALCFLISYFIINLMYSYGLKNIAILDVMLLASGFILRVYYGAAIINIEVSNWLFLTVLSASLFLGLGKRKKELLISKKSRKALLQYNEKFLDKFQYISLGLTLVFYSLWSLEQNIKYLYLSIPLLIIIFMRYCLIIENSDEGDPTTVLYSDKILIGLCLLFALFMIVILGV